MQNEIKETKKEAFYRWLNGETTLNEEKFEVVHQPKSRRRKKRKRKTCPFTAPKEFLFPRTLPFS